MKRFFTKTGIWLLAAAATIATLAVPALYEQSILFRFAVILLAGLFGVPGLAFRRGGLGRRH